MVDNLAGKEVAPYDCVLKSVGKKSPTNTYIIANDPLINNFPIMLHAITAVSFTKRESSLKNLLAMLHHACSLESAKNC